MQCPRRKLYNFSGDDEITRYKVHGTKRYWHVLPKTRPCTETKIVRKNSREGEGGVRGGCFHRKMVNQKWRVSAATLTNADDTKFLYESAGTGYNFNIDTIALCSASRIIGV